MKMMIEQAESTGTITHYRPQRDPADALALVVFMAPEPHPSSADRMIKDSPPTQDELRRAAKSRGFVDIVASWGVALEYALDGDRAAELAHFAQILSDKPDGLYVLEGCWIGSGEDIEYSIRTVRDLTSIERQYIYENGDYRGVEHLWAERWASIPCAHCGKFPVDHDFDFTCPKVLPGPLTINWWTDQDLRSILNRLANLLQVDVLGQRDEQDLTRAELIAEIRSLARVLAEAEVLPVEFIEIEGDS